MERWVIGRLQQEAVMRHAMYLVPVLMLTLLPVSADAQGKSGKAKSGGGPSFCRSGAGHPVFGWEWCRQRGWGNSSGARNERIVQRDRGDAYPDRDRDRRLNDVAFDNGYADGYEKGLDDARDGRSADPTRHGWYRSADRHYDPQYGSRAHYANIYRDGFKSGYQAGFGDGERYGGDRSSGRRFPWPF
jgi:hypothetical protein